MRKGILQEKDILFYIKDMPGGNIKLLYVNNSLYVCACEQVGNYSNHVSYIFNREMNQVDKIILSEDLNTHATFYWGKIAFDGKNIYIAEIGNKPGNAEWTVQLRSNLFEESLSLRVILVIIMIIVIIWSLLAIITRRCRARGILRLIVRW